MHAVVVRVSVNDVETAESMLREQVVPRVQQMPGFVNGYWTRAEGNGLSMILFDSEENARQASEQVQANMPPEEAVTLDSAEVREVVAQA
jgi:alpha-D-ribose 1-methylphosphonate 5-triphosphate synthase subunit PhnI